MRLARCFALHGGMVGCFLAAAAAQTEPAVKMAVYTQGMDGCSPADSCSMRGSRPAGFQLATGGPVPAVLLGETSQTGSVPQPSTLLLVGTGLVGLAITARRRWRPRGAVTADQP